MKPIYLLVLLNLFVFTLSAREADWQNSYRLEALGQYAEAITAIDPVLANEPAAELKALRRGWLYYLLGNYNEAIREYRYAKERNMRSIDALLGVTLPLLAQKRWREAEQNAHKALELAPNNFTGLLRLTMALEGRRNWLEMKKMAAAMVVFYPSNYTAYVYLARAYARLNQHSNAVTAYVAVLMRYPGHREAKAYIAQ